MNLTSDASAAFTALEQDVSTYIRSILDQLASTDEPGVYEATTKTVSLKLSQLSKLRRFLIFLRFRNSAGYAAIVRKLHADLEQQKGDGNLYPAYRHIIVQIQRRYVLRAFTDFLQGNDRRADRRHDDALGEKFVNFFHDIMDTYCWRMLYAEVCVGVVTEERETGREEYILPESCYGSLEEGYEEDPYVPFQSFSIFL